jgi:hypothetical protein
MPGVFYFIIAFALTDRILSSHVAETLFVSETTKKQAVILSNHAAFSESLRKI